MMQPARPILSIPPFPGARPPAFAISDITAANGADVGDPQTLLDALVAHRAGGCYWGNQPELPAEPYVLDATAEPVAGALGWPEHADPWHFLDGAKEVRLPWSDHRALLAIAAGKPVSLLDAKGREQPAELEEILQQQLTGWRWRDPFSGAIIPALQAIELCGFWRRLIDANRKISAALGFAHWKHPTVAPLLWNGHTTPFRRGVPRLKAGDQVAVWLSRLSARQQTALEGLQLVEVEDGFIRSTGLGADCVPPLSIIVDDKGVHFDPGTPSGLELLLQTGDFPDALIARAAELRAAIVVNGLSKYEQGAVPALPRPGGARRHVLVPGQVEDDRAVTSGGALSSNLELLRRARAETGANSFIIYKPHPDVLAGHRRGMIADDDLAGLADRVETGAPMAALIALVDELHVNSSLAGFEALLRGKPVTVHGVPFYAGWGLTTDHGPVPARRKARRTLDELVAAALLLYPRYLDPDTGLPCPAEVLVRRLSGSRRQQLDVKASLIVHARQALGHLRTWLGR